MNRFLLILSLLWLGAVPVFASSTQISVGMTGTVPCVLASTVSTNAAENVLYLYKSGSLVGTVGVNAYATTTVTIGGVTINYQAYDHSVSVSSGAAAAGYTLALYNFDGGYQDEWYFDIVGNSVPAPSGCFYVWVNHVLFLQFQGLSSVGQVFVQLSTSSKTVFENDPADGFRQNLSDPSSGLGASTGFVTLQYGGSSFNLPPAPADDGGTGTGTGTGTTPPCDPLKDPGCYTSLPGLGGGDPVGTGGGGWFGMIFDAVAKATEQVMTYMFKPDPTVMVQFEANLARFLNWGPYQILTQILSLSSSGGNGSALGLTIPVPQYVVSTSYTVGLGGVQGIPSVTWIDTGQRVPIAFNLVTGTSAWQSFRTVLGGGVWVIMGLWAFKKLFPSHSF